MQVFNSLVSLSDSGNGEVSHRQENDEHDDDSYKYIGLNLFIAIETSQRLSISDFCEFLQKSEIESLFSCFYRQFIVLLQKISETTNVK